MYFFPKFCRICIQTGVKLLDIDTVDYDDVKLSEKLEECSKMATSRESPSSQICVDCVKKLRVSYQFQEMCKKSSKILQGYLTKLLGEKQKVDPNEFVSDDLNVFVTPLTKCDVSCDVFFYNAKQAINKRKQRITKGQRCSLLKQLLLPNREKLKKERDKTVLNTIDDLIDDQCGKGGLKNIINFTRNYNFSCLDKNSNIKLTPLDKLKEFSENFFKKDFSEFRDAVLYIIENKDNSCESGTESDDEDFFINNLEKNQFQAVVKFEEILVEPDIKVKNEPVDYEEEGDRLPYGYVEAIYTEHLDVKQEQDADISETEILEQKHVPEDLLLNSSSQNNIYNNDFANSSQLSESSSMQLLDNLVSSYSVNGRKHFSPFNVRCRTRNNPYINPNIKEQFLYRSFRCHMCNRYFKSQGYLKAHNSKVH